MHELSVVFHIADTVEKLAIENNVKKVKKVVMEIGEVSMIVSPYLVDCWNWVCSKRELLNGCEMEIIDLPAVTYCEDCGKEYETVKYGKTCPFCQSEKTYLIRGQEINIKEIGVTDE